MGAVGHILYYIRKTDWCTFLIGKMIATSFLWPCIAKSMWHPHGWQFYPWCESVLLALCGKALLYGNGHGYWASMPHGLWMKKQETTYTLIISCLWLEDTNSMT
jgi:hypothetical protein